MEILIAVVVLEISPQIALPTRAEAAHVQLRLANAEQEARIVSPLVVRPLATVRMEVQDHDVSLKTISFAVDGIYDPANIQGFYLYVDGVQAGDPQMPDSDGKIRFLARAVEISPGMHTINIALTSYAFAEGSSIQILFDPDESFVFDDRFPVVATQFQQPYAGPRYTFVAHGSLGVFVRKTSAAPARGASELYVYADAEDVNLDSLVFSADQKISTGRLDLFYNSAFLSSGAFVDGQATVAVTGKNFTALNGKNAAVRVLATDIVPNNSPVGITLTRIAGHGARSGIGIEQSVQLHLFDAP